MSDFKNRTGTIGGAARVKAAIIRDVVDLKPLSSEGIALLDSKGIILATNENWEIVARQYGVSPEDVGAGTSYVDLCRRSTSSPRNAREVLAGIRSVLKGKTPFFSTDYDCDASAEPVTFRITATRIAYGDACLAITHTNITELKRAEEEKSRNLRRLAGRLIHAQEEERRRISAEMHDDLGSRIALLAFSIQHIISEQSGTEDRTVLQLREVLDKISDLSNALRSLSRGLHPPMLQYAGISESLKLLCEEFEKTRGLRIDVVVPPVIEDLPTEVGLCVFRVAQECLQNIARHSGAGQARLVFERTRRQVRLRVSDTGKGFVEGEAIRKGGLGLISMKERVQYLRGSLEVDSAPGCGTEVRVTIPVTTAA